MAFTIFESSCPTKSVSRSALVSECAFENDDDDDDYDGSIMTLIFVRTRQICMRIGSSWLRRIQS